MNMIVEDPHDIHICDGKVSHGGKCIIMHHSICATPNGQSMKLYQYV